jgi:hypothetical protein
MTGPIMQFTSARGVSVAAALALAVGLSAWPAQAAPDQARETVGLFVQSCLKYVEDPADLQAWIRATPQLRKFATQEASALLGGQRGDVWNAENDAGLFYLVVLADATCSVIAQQASADQVSLVFEDYVLRKRLPLNRIGDKTDYVRGIDLREETWRTSGGDFPYEVVVTTSKSPRAEAQAILTTHPNR